MLTHDLRFALRLIRRSPGEAALTIGGFAVALASCILVLLFVRHERGYDAWLRDVDQLHRIHMRLAIPGREPTTTPRALGPLAERLAHDVEVEAVGRMLVHDRTPVIHDNRARYDSLAFVDPSLFDVLDLPLVSGTRALADPQALLVTESAARDYFGDADPIGRTLTVRDRNGPNELRVTGVLRDLPPQTHLALRLVARVDAFADRERAEWAASWDNVFGYMYVRLRPGADRAGVEQRLQAAVDTHRRGAAEGESHFTALVVPVRDLHLDTGTDHDDMRPAGDPTTLYAISGVGVLLLLLAIGNFLNLATARSGRRAREIAIRKAAGAEPRDIVVQYLTEAVLVTLCALVVALALVELALPWFEQLSGRALPPPHEPLLLLGLAVGAVALGVISGLYPALVLARYRPAAVMSQTQASLARGSGRLRAVLVFAQFAAAIALALGTTVVYRQARFASELDLGFTHRDRLVVDGIASSVVRPAITAWLEQAARIPGVERVTATSDPPGRPNGMNTMVQVPDSGEPQSMLHVAWVDYELFPTLGVEPLAGRVFSREIASDDASAEPLAGERAVMLNEAAVRRLGLGSPAAAVGRALAISVSRDELGPCRVIGVVPDLHFGSMRRAVEPTVFLRIARGFWSALIAYRPGSGQSVHRALEAQWIAAFPEQPFAASFVESDIDELYRNDHRLAAILSTAALLALAVACLGLYGLSAFLAEARRKEIAVRKVLGASTLDIVRLLAWQLARPLALACVVAVPLAYVAAERWLAGFTYRIAIGPLWIAATIAAALAIAAATVAVQSVRSARATPIDALHAD